MRVELIGDAAAFEGLRGEWNHLLSRCTSNGVFLTWEWLHTWWKHFSGERRLAIVAVRDGSNLVALAPFFVRPSAPRRLRPYRAIEFLGSGTIGSDYLDLIMAPEAEEEALDELAAFLRRMGYPLELGQLGPTSIVERLAQRLHDWPRRRVHVNICPYIPIAGHTWESYLASRSTDHRTNIPRRLKKLESVHRVSFERASDEASRADFLRCLIDLHDRRWADRGGDAFHTSAHRAFHDEFTRLALCNGWLRLFVLKIDGRSAGALYGFRYGPKFAFYQSGFDPEMGKVSPGVVTLAYSIRHAIEEGAAEYDMLHGPEEYKFHWTSLTRDLLRLEMMPSGARGLYPRACVSTASVARTLARQVLARGVRSS